jgi:hypothetical protein
MAVLKSVEDAVGAPASYDEDLGWCVPVGQWWRGQRMRRGRRFRVEWLGATSVVTVELYVNRRRVNAVCWRPTWKTSYDLHIEAHNKTAVIAALQREVATKSRARRL